MYLYMHVYILFIYIMLLKIPWRTPLVESLKRLSIKTQNQQSWSSTDCNYTES